MVICYCLGFVVCRDNHDLTIVNVDIATTGRAVEMTDACDFRAARWLTSSEMNEKQKLRKEFLDLTVRYRINSGLPFSYTLQSPGG
jgi:tRNA-binding EMAP/Myf-like protein